MRVTQVGYAWDPQLCDPDQLLDSYATLTGWSEALRNTGAAHVSVVHAFARHSRIVRNGIEYVFCRPGSIGKAVAASTPDVVHVNGLGFPARTWWLRRSLRTQTVLVVQDHASGLRDRRSGYAHALRSAVRGLMMRAADGYLFSAHEQARPWQQAGLIAGRQPVCEVLEASTAIQPVNQSEARAATKINGDPAVLWVGRLNANKDPLTVLEGFELGCAYLPDATLTMVFAADDLLTAVRSRVARSPGLAARVRLVGAVAPAHMAAYYSAADIFILGSHHEGSGYALLESCACGVPPVVTDIPSFRRITADGRVGALWPVGNPAALANALVDVARRDRESQRRATRDHFDRALSWTAVGNEALRAYRHIRTYRIAGWQDGRMAGDK
jgi:glycosyltransferase involved in cell wall biosynthesis